MSKIDELLKDGTVIQDPENEDRVIFNVPIYIKKVAVDMGGFEAFAGAYGYTAKIKNEAGEEIDNPDTVHVACIKVIWNFVKEVFKASMLNQARAQAEDQAKAQIETLVG